MTKPLMLRGSYDTNSKVQTIAFCDVLRVFVNEEDKRLEVELPEDVVFYAGFDDTAYTTALLNVTNLASFAMWVGA